jgi:hypothetical protein
MTTRRLALAASAVALLAAAPPATAAPVTSGKLEWTMANTYASGDYMRTALGYFLHGPGETNGSVTPAAPATLANAIGQPLTGALTTATPMSVDRPYTLGFPADSGTYEAGVASVELRGTFTFVTHTIPITFVDPLLTLSGTTGTIAASGSTASMSGQTTPYDRSKTQFNLDLSNATVATGVDGAKVISAIKPLGTADTFISFGPGSPLYGTMKLTLKVPETPASPPKEGAQGPAGPAGRSALIKALSLKKAPFAGGGEHRVKLLDRKSRAVLATGTIKKRTLRVAYLDGTALKGGFTLRLQAGAVKGKREATISL